MRVMNIMADSADGGAPNFFVRLGVALHRRGVDQHMVFSPHPAREAIFRQAGVPYTVVDFDRWAGLPGRLAVRALARRERPDVVMAWLNRAARRLPSGPHVTVGRLGGKYGLRHYRRCDHIVANSPVLMDYAASQLSAPVEMICNFVTLGAIDPVALPRSGRPLLLGVGRLRPQKGFDLLIRALADVPADLWIAGDGPELGALQALANALGVADRVRFLGWRDDVPSLIAAADMFVFPSRYEGTSNAVLEAMALAKPVIVTAGESVGWFLEDRHDARIVELDEAALAAGINALVEHPEEAARIGANGRTTYETRFSEDVICGQWIAFFEKIVADRRA